MLNIDVKKQQWSVDTHKRTAVTQENKSALFSSELMDHITSH